MSKSTSPNSAKRQDTKSCELIELARRLIFFATQPDDAPGDAPPDSNSSFPDDHILALIALEESKLRKARFEHFDSSLFGEPVWDILLELYISEQDGRPWTVSSCAVASGVPQTTALRCLGKLEQMGLVVRTQSKADKRVAHIRLSQAGRLQMRNALSHYARSRLSSKFDVVDT